MVAKVKKTRKIVALIFWPLFLLWLLWFLKFADHYPKYIDLQVKPNFWGLTFSTKFAKSLNLDWQQVYLEVINDLAVKNIRVPIYWDEIEPSPGEFDFSSYDFILDEGKAKQVKFIINLGWRLPRWPECHAPAWAKNKTNLEQQQAILQMISKIVGRYQDRPEIVMWQVENEPLFDWFGECPDGDREFLEKEVALVKSLDNSRPILISASGELSTWQSEAKIGNMMGTTMYRVVWNKWFGYFRYPWPSWFYGVKARLVGLPKANLMISELQAEPWVPHGSLASFPKEEYVKSMSLEQLKANLQYAINTDLSQAYLWGVEWWYLQKQQGNGEYWSLMKQVFQSE